jgi:hypothetical protein
VTRVGGVWCRGVVIVCSTTIVVMGGTPAGENIATSDVGFAEWAAHVDTYPMPVPPPTRAAPVPMAVCARAPRRGHSGCACEHVRRT